jgi:hypothetical protein
VGRLGGVPLRFMNKHIAAALLSLLGSLAIVGLSWWLRQRALWEGASTLLVAGGVLTAFFAIRLVLRIGQGTRPAPMN